MKLFDHTNLDNNYCIGSWYVFEIFRKEKDQTNRNGALNKEQTTNIHCPLQKSLKPMTEVI